MAGRISSPLIVPSWSLSSDRRATAALAISSASRLPSPLASRASRSGSRGGPKGRPGPASPGTPARGPRPKLSRPPSSARSRSPRPSSRRRRSWSPSRRPSRGVSRGGVSSPSGGWAIAVVPSMSRQAASIGVTRRPREKSERMVSECMAASPVTRSGPRGTARARTWLRNLQQKFNAAGAARFLANEGSGRGGGAVVNTTGFPDLPSSTPRIKKHRHRPLLTRSLPVATSGCWTR